MASDTKVKPALTAEEWARLNVVRPENKRTSWGAEWVSKSGAISITEDGAVSMEAGGAGYAVVHPVGTASMLLPLRVPRRPHRGPAAACRMTSPEQDQDGPFVTITGIDVSSNDLIRLLWRLLYAVLFVGAVLAVVAGVLYGLWLATQG